MSKFIKPEFNIVYAYSQKQIKFYIGKFANKHPQEHQEEMVQDAYERIWKAYQKIDRPDWKGFIQNHCRGAILDYIKMGRGFAEENLTIKNPKEKVLKKYPHMLRQKQYPSETKEGKEIKNDPEIVAGQYYQMLINHLPERPEIKINWEMIALIAPLDRDLHITAKLLLGFKLTELAEIFNVKREHISQRFNVFIKRLDDPRYIGDQWVENIIWALGLNEVYGLEVPPRKIMFHVEPIDLWSTEKISGKKVPIQLSFKF